MDTLDKYGLSYLLNCILNIVQVVTQMLTLFENNPDYLLQYSYREKKCILYFRSLSIY
jgi:hypothetical protein